MRQGRDNEILFRDGKLIGINLGADYCAEHEWGIDNINRSFGIDRTNFGVKGRQITQISPNLTWIKKADISYSFNKNINKLDWNGLLFTDNRYSNNYTDMVANNTKMVSAWSDGDFAAMSAEKSEIDKLEEVYQAFQKLDIAIWLGGGGVFNNAGLCFGIISRLSSKITDAWYQKDKKHFDLNAEVDATGIKELLKKAGKEYFALSPSRMSDGSIKYWLNPMQQHHYDTNWYTLQDLKDWANNRGRVIKKK